MNLSSIKMKVFFIIASVGLISLIGGWFYTLYMKSTLENSTIQERKKRYRVDKRGWINGK
jgi:hypothetical protein